MSEISSITENPYVGPRTFTRVEGDRFFGRELEARQLLSRVISERLVLFYAQSGAGKSSLINTRLIPQLQEADFDVLPVGRVSGELPDGVSEVDNIFVFNLILSLDQGNNDANQFNQMTLAQFLNGLTTADGEHYTYSEAVSDSQAIDDEEYEDIPHILIIDQFEEIVTTHTARWTERETFFRQLDQAMTADPMLWVVLTLREDYVAALEPYADLVTDKMRARFYMQRMDYRAALTAVKRPAEQSGRIYAPGVAESLVDNLRQIRLQGQADTQSGQFVEPVQLQVVCYQLWDNFKERSTKEITQQDLQDMGNVDAALAQFYEQVISRVIATIDISENYLRDWFDRKLITEAETRGSVYRGPDRTGGLPTEVADTLANQFLLRSETRAGGIWYELVHDRFIGPILKANQAWRLEHGSTDIVDIQLANSDQTVSVMQVASYEVTLTNIGATAAQFLVDIEGIDKRWVTIFSEPTIQLDEGDKATIIFEVLPPRDPASAAGRHKFVVVVTSPEYPERQSQHEANLDIQPYFDFALNDLTPKRQTISWFERMGQIFVPITNQGNTATHFLLSGTDSLNRCVFEFEQPDGDATYSQEIEVSIPLESTLAISARVTSLVRPFIGLRPRRHNLTITTRTVEDESISRSVSGQLQVKPLIGPSAIFVLVFIAIAFVIWINIPRITNFNINGSKEIGVTAGDTVTLRWNTSLLANLQINPKLGEVGGPLGTATVVPTENTIYELRADTLLSRLSSRFTAVEEVRVVVTPVFPKISLFEADLENVVVGEDVIISWQVLDADDLILEINGVPQSLSDFTGQFTNSPKAGNTQYVLVAKNQYGEERSNQSVNAVTPTPIPPKIHFFEVDVETVVVGESVTLSWQVSDADNLILEINGIPQALPDFSGTFTDSPDGVTEYALIAVNQFLSEISTQSVIAVTPTPVPPKILFFEADKEEIISYGDVTLSWQVIDADNLVLEINGVPQALSDFSGTFTDSPYSTKEYVLVASNQYLSERITQSVRVFQPTPTPIPTPYVESFLVDPPVIVEGEEVTISWNVEYGDDVSVSPLGTDLPLVHSIIRTPSQTTNYVLNARLGPALAGPLTRTVFVTPAFAPEIEYFLADKSGSQVELSWSVSGGSTIEISELVAGPSGFQPRNNYIGEHTDTLSVPISETTLFVLTAQGLREGEQDIQAILVTIP